MQPTPQTPALQTLAAHTIPHWDQETDVLVIGRPITGAGDSAQAAAAIHAGLK